MKTYKLTDRETAFLTNFLEDNGCGAQTMSHLEDDNFTCQCVEDLMETAEMDAHTVGGFLSALDQKCMIWIEDQRGHGDPDLWWLSDAVVNAVIESGQGDLPFAEIDYSKVEA